MEDVHKHVITLMDPISVPAGMVISWTVIIIHVLVSAALYSSNSWHHLKIIQILRNVLLVLTTALIIVWNSMEDMSVDVLMDMN